MKTLFILLTLFFVSCKQYPNNITSIVKVPKDSCYYKVNQYWKRDNTLCCSSYVLVPCGFYNDGDTLGKPSKPNYFGDVWVEEKLDSAIAVNDSIIRFYYNSGKTQDLTAVKDSLQPRRFDQMDSEAIYKYNPTQDSIWAKIGDTIK